MNRAPSTARDVIDAYLRRYPDADHAALTDSMYAWQINMLRSVLSLVDMALEDEDIPEEVRARVLRAALYGGAPKPIEADERRREQLEKLAAMSLTPDEISKAVGRFRHHETP